MARILVVDDETGIRELLSEILTDVGHEVVVAESAAQARTKFLSHHPELVLLDVLLPDEDGITVLQHWTRSHPDVRVVMLSGHATIDTAVEATRIGALEFLEKPISLQRLLGTVRRALASQPKPGPIKPDRNGAPESTPTRGRSWVDLPLNLPWREAREEFERAYFNHMLGLAGGNVAQVALRTGLERTQIYRKLRRLEIRNGAPSLEL
jgi:DNA-binding NtrC family response regulator